MEILGHSSNWNPRISLKHPNGYELESLVEEGDRVECTVVSCTSSGTQYDLDIDVALPVDSVTDDAIKLAKFPRYARNEFKQQASTPTSQLVFDVHAVVDSSGERHPVDSDSSGDPTEVYTITCDECGGQARPDASYCPDCGEEL